MIRPLLLPLSTKSPIFLLSPMTRVRNWLAMPALAVYSEGMPAPRDITSLSHEELVVLVITLMQQIEKLEKENEELRKGGKRQAAPFSKGTRKDNPKKPGRKKGEGQFTQRGEPAPADST